MTDKEFIEYHCLKYNDNEKQMKECSIFIEDEHCFNCPCYQSFDKLTPISEKTKRKYLKKTIEILKYIMTNHDRQRIS